MSDQKPRDRFNPYLGLAVVLCVVLLYAAGVTTFVLDQFHEADSQVERSPTESVLEPRVEPQVETRKLEESIDTPESYAEQPNRPLASPRLEVDWQHFLGSGRENVVSSVATDSKGNVYFAGAFRGELELPDGASPNVYVSKGRDAYLLKFAASGRLIWSKVLSTTQRESIGNLVVLPNDDVLVTGQKRSRAYAARFSGSGESVWERQSEGTHESGAGAVAVGVDGSVYVGGGFRGTLIFDTDKPALSVESKGARDGFLARLNSDGELLWIFGIGNRGKSSISGLGGAPDGVVATGYFKGKIDADPGDGVNMLGSGTGMDSFVAKYDESGQHIWGTDLGSSENQVSSTLLRANGRIYVGGHFTGRLSGRNGEAQHSVAARGWDMFVAVYSDTGELRGLTRWGTDGIERLYDLVQLKDGNITVSGFTEGQPAIGSSRDPEFLLTIEDQNGSMPTAALFRSAAESDDGFFAGGSTVDWPFGSDGALYIGRYTLAAR